MQQYFLSYSRHDTDIALRLVNDLRENHISIWVDQLELPAGKHWDRGIERALAASSGLLLLLSPNSVASENVLDEIHYALENNLAIIPVLLEACRVPYRVSRLEHVDIREHYATGVTKLSSVLVAGKTARRDDLDSQDDGAINQADSAEQLPSLAVLPFQQLSQDEESVVLADGVLNEVVRALSGNPDLFVISSGSTARMEQADQQRQAQALGVKYYVTGQLQKAGQQVRLNLSMIESDSRKVVWGERFDRELKDLFQVQDDIARGIVHQLLRRFDAYEFAHYRQAPAIDLTAWQLYQKARHMSANFEERGESLDILRRVIDLDPSFARGYGLLATRLAGLRWMGKYDYLQEAGELADQALALAPTDNECMLSASEVYHSTGQHDRAQMLVEQALDHNPNSADAWAHLGVCLAVKGRNEEGLEALHYALQLSPKDQARFLWHAQQAISYINMNQYQPALKAIRASVSLNPAFFWSQMCLAQCHAMLAEKAPALTAWQAAQTLNTSINIGNFRGWLENSALTQEQRSEIVDSLLAAGCT